MSKRRRREVWSPRRIEGVTDQTISTTTMNRRGGLGSVVEGGNLYARRYDRAIATGMELHEHRPGPVRTLAQMTPEERAEMVRLYSRKAK